ncbi:MAG: hypothetical protein ACRDHF_03935 [Tepidiformaceae bacterium]
MAAQPNGLRRDLNLVRRRAWLFIPFFLLGILVAYVFGSVAGDSNAVATLTLDTVVQNVTPSGDRGFRIFEAESMTADPRFKERVIERIGEPDFDYGRYTISLSPVSVADGVSRGVLTISVSDPDKKKAEHYRGAFVAVFSEEYLEPNGLFRERFIGKKQEVADAAEANFEEQYAIAKPLAEAANIPLDELIRPRFEDNFSLLDGLAAEEAEIRGLLALARASGDTAETQRLESALEDLQSQRSSLSEGNMPLELRRAIGDLRGANATRTSAYQALNDARTAASSAQSDMETSYTFSGGLASSLLGRIAVVIAVTLVFGLIAIYSWEWLSQVRSGMEESPKQDSPSSAG